LGQVACQTVAGWRGGAAVEQGMERAATTPG